jgi:hypothetical protein
LHKEYGASVSHNADERTIVSSALRDTFIKHFQMLGMKRSWNTSSAVRFFSKRWAFYRDQFQKPKDRYGRTTTLLVKAQDTLLRLPSIFDSGYELAAVNFPTELSIREWLICDSLDLVVTKKNRHGTDIELYFLDDSLHAKDMNDFGVLLRATVGLSSAKNDLIGTNSKVKCFLLHTLSLKKQEIILEKEHRTHYPRLIGNIIRGIETSSIYPRSSYEECTHCTYRNVCSWRLR